MNTTTPYPILEYIVNLIAGTIEGIQIEYASKSIAILKDGNATIHLEQLFDTTGNFATIFIKDPKDIIFSEDLYPNLNSLHHDVAGGLGNALKTTTIIINDLDIETQLIFQAVKDEFDQISNSYEFVKHTENEITTVKSLVKFGKHAFELLVMNEQNAVLMNADVSTGTDPAVIKTIEDNTFAVQQRLNQLFKEDKTLKEALNLKRV